MEKPRQDSATARTSARVATPASQCGEEAVHVRSLVSDGEYLFCHAGMVAQRAEKWIRISLTRTSGSVPNDAPLKDQSIGAIRKVDSTFGSDALAYMDGCGNSFPAAACRGAELGNAYVARRLKSLAAPRICWAGFGRPLRSL